MLDRLADPLLRTFGSLDAVPQAWREVLEGLSETLSQAEQERARLLRALDRTTTELQELLCELDALRRARHTAESTNLVRGEILATVSRTMRSPADAILGLTALLRTGALLLVWGGSGAPRNTRMSPAGCVSASWVTRVTFPCPGG